MINIPEQGTRIGEKEARGLWDLIESYPLPFGADYLNYKLKWETDYGDLALSEYKRFAFLALLSGSEITPSEQIDQVWHLHILHTADYASFAKKCGRFLHHAPGMPSQRPTFNRQYIQTHKLYEEVFGEEPPSSIWPLRKPGVIEQGPSILRVLELYLARKRQEQGINREAV